MKAILVVDLGNADSDYYFIDYVIRSKETGGALEVGYNVNLKPMPTKIYISAFNKETGEKVNLPKFDGYNACIDEILGEEE